MIAIATASKHAYQLFHSTAGPLPDSLGALPSLTVLQAGNNALSGTGSLVAFSQVRHSRFWLPVCLRSVAGWQQCAVRHWQPGGVLPGV